MSGYAGVDDEALHAIILSENGVYAAQQEIQGTVSSHCIDCGDDIDARRVEFARKHSMKCIRCIHCQGIFDSAPKRKIRMLDHIL